MKPMMAKLVVFVLLLAFGKYSVAKEQVDVLFLYDEHAAQTVDVHATVEQWVAELNDMYHYSGAKLKVNAVGIEFDEDDRYYSASILDRMANGDRVRILRDHFGADFVMKFSELTTPAVFASGIYGNQKDPTLAWKTNRLQKLCSDACSSIQTSRGQAMCYDNTSFCQHVSAPASCTVKCSGITKSSDRNACYASEPACDVNGASVKLLKGLAGFIGAARIKDSDGNCTVEAFDGNHVQGGADCTDYRVLSKSYGGRAYDISTTEDKAFAVMDLDMDARTLGHELGHVMGLAHQAPYTGSDGKLFARGHGEDGKFVTIMAYGSHFNDSGDPVRVEYFSNPNKGNCMAAHGDAMDNSAPCGIPVGQTNEAHAVKRLNQKRVDFANFRPTRNPGDKALQCVEKCEAIDTTRGRAMCYDLDPLCQDLADNLLSSNGTFSSGQGNFQTYIVSPSNTVSFAGGDTTFNMGVWSIEAWHVQLIHELNIQQGNQYTVCFDANAEYTRQIYVDIDNGDPNYSSVMDVEPQVSAEMTKRQHSHTFIATASDTNARLTFNVAWGIGELSLDNIGVYEGSVCGSPL